MVSSIQVYQELLKNGAEGNGGRKAKVGTLAHPLPELPAKLATGVRRLDDLLGGGLPRGSSTLLYGPPFSGKAIVQRKFFLEGLRQGQPGIYVLTDTSAAQLSQGLSKHEPNMPLFEKRGVSSYIDVYTRLIGERGDHRHAHYVEDPQRWEQILGLVERASADQQRRHPGPQRLVIESISSLMVELGPSTTFRFLRSLLGRFTLRGGTALLAIEAGMHESHQIQSVKHLCRGMISTRETNEHFSLRVDGLPTEFQPGWVEYEFDDEKLELTGSFASGRIRGGNIAT